MTTARYLFGILFLFATFGMVACQPYAEEEELASPLTRNPLLITVDMTHHDILRRSAHPIEFPLDLQEKFFIQEMQDFFNAHKSPMLEKPAGLSAPQLGMPLRIILIHIPPEAKKLHPDVYDEWPPTILINPMYTPIAKLGKKKDWESCYSTPNKMGEIYRYNAISYSAYDINGKKITGVAKGFLARYIQHEVDHLNGVLYIDLLCAGCRYMDFRALLKIREKEGSL